MVLNGSGGKGKRWESDGNQMGIKRVDVSILPHGDNWHLNAKKRENDELNI